MQRSKNIPPINIFMCLHFPCIVELRRDGTYVYVSNTRIIRVKRDKSNFPGPNVRCKESFSREKSVFRTKCDELRAWMRAAGRNGEGGGGPEGKD